MDFIFVDVGSIVQSVNGPSLIISELANNINTFQRAMGQIKKPNFNRSIINFIRRLFSSKRHALLKSNSSNIDNLIHVGCAHVIPNDRLIMNYIHVTCARNVSLHRNCWKG